MRPIMAMPEAPASAKARAIDAPIPEPPPVMATILPLAESSGRVGLMAALEVVCQSLVRDGKGAEVVIVFEWSVLG